MTNRRESQQMHRRSLTTSRFKANPFLVVKQLCRERIYKCFKTFAVTCDAKLR